VEDFDKINLIGGVTSTLYEAESLRDVASTLNMIVLCLILFPILLLIVIAITGNSNDIGISGSLIGKNVEEWLQLYKKMN